MTPITVIIPTYNRAEVVGMAIRSVLEQTSPAAEIIVVDDGSKDDTPESLASFGDAITVIRKENAGLSAARNTGIAAAKTEWVAFLDDDDEFIPERLEIAAEGIAAHPEIGVHLVNTQIEEDGGKTHDLFALREMPCGQQMVVRRPLEWVLKGCFFAQSLVVRRSVVESAGLFRDTLYEDMDLYVRLTQETPWLIDGRAALRLIRRDDGGAMSEEWRQKPIGRCEALVAIHRAALALPEINQDERSMTEQRLGTYLFELGRAQIGAGEDAAAKANFREARENFKEPVSRAKALGAYTGGGLFLQVFDRLNWKQKGLVR